MRKTISNSIAFARLNQKAIVNERLCDAHCAKHAKLLIKYSQAGVNARLRLLLFLWHRCCARGVRWKQPNHLINLSNETARCKSYNRITVFVRDANAKNKKSHLLVCWTELRYHTFCEFVAHSKLLINKVQCETLEGVRFHPIVGCSIAVCLFYWCVLICDPSCLHVMPRGREQRSEDEMLASVLFMYSGVPVQWTDSNNTNNKSPTNRRKKNFGKRKYECK